MFFKIYVILFMFSLLLGCSSFDHQSSPHVKSDREIEKKNTKELKEEKASPLAETESLQTTGLNQEFPDNIVPTEATIAEETAKDGAKISIDVYSLKYSLFLLNGKGFKPYESLIFVSTSWDDVVHTPMNADENGHLPIITLQAAVTGKLGGICYIDLFREQESIHMQFPWGSEILRRN